LMMRFAAGLFSYAVEREPILKSAAYLLVFNIGIELMLSEFHVMELGGYARFGISIGTILICLAYAHSASLRKIKPALMWIAEGMSHFNAVLDWILKPLILFFRVIGSTIGKLFPSKRYSIGGPEEGPDDD
jgi:tellurite resistance protein TerC